MKSPFCEYVLDERYSTDRTELIRAYNIIEKDIKKLLEFVEPCNKNAETYSLKAYELLIRIATEFESNCKLILKANGYLGTSRDMNILDYKKLNIPLKLSEYKVIMESWKDNKEFCPFEDWNVGASLHWYTSYNNVKHNRTQEFSKANLKEVVSAAAGLQVILFSQFGVYSMSGYQNTEMVNDHSDGSIYVGDSLFRIVEPTTWLLSDKYDFEWDVLRSNINPFDVFTF
jgi:hypothetical protein